LSYAPVWLKERSRLHFLHSRLPPGR